MNRWLPPSALPLNNIPKLLRANDRMLPSQHFGGIEMGNQVIRKTWEISVHCDGRE